MDEMESIMAIQDCMDALGLEITKERSFLVEAQITNNLHRASQGKIEVTFQSNWHSGDGPYVEIDSVIRSYRINYEKFKPRWQKFTFSIETLVLNIKGNGYDFDLKFGN